MNQVPTTEEFLQNHLQISHFYDDKTDRMVCFSDDVQQAMIEFAKMHVQAALKAAAENSVKMSATQATIENSYPLENIK